MSAEKVAHTPGPWKADKGGFNYIGEYDHWGTVRGGPKIYNLVTVWADVPELASQAEANARLIASAPELLALAKRYASECGMCGGTGRRMALGPDGSETHAVDCATCADIRAVIEKAEGGA